MLKKIEVEKNGLYMSEECGEARNKIIRSEKEEKIRSIESTFGIRLFDWQKDFIFENIPYDRGVEFARRAGKTFARCLKICFSKGAPIYICKNQYSHPRALEQNFMRMAGEDGNTRQRFAFFMDELQKVYKALLEADAPGLREIYFTKG